MSVRMRIISLIHGKFIWGCLLTLLLVSPALASDDALLTVQLGHADGVTAVAFSPDGTMIVSGSADNTAKLWDRATGREIRTFRGHAGDVTAVTFSADSKTVISGSANGSIKIWNVAQGRETGTLRSKQSSGVTSVALSADGKMLVSGSFAGNVILWDVSTRQELRTFKGHLKAVDSVAFAPNGKMVVSCSRDETVRLWPVAKDAEPVTLRGHKSWVRSVAFSPDSKLVASGGYDATLKLWDVATAREVRNFTGHSDSVESVVFSLDGNFLISGSGDKTVKVWNRADGSMTLSISGHDRWIRAVALSPDGKTLASAGYDNKVKLWDLNSGKLISTLSGDVGSVGRIVLSADGKKMASIGANGKVRLWDFIAGSESVKITDNESVVRTVAFSPDSQALLTVNQNNLLKLWEVSSGKLLRSLKMDQDFQSFLFFSVDGSGIVTSYRDNTVRVLDVVSGNVLYSMQGNLLPKQEISPDGKTELQNGTSIFSLTTEETVRTFTKYEGNVLSSAFFPGGDYVVSGGSNGTVMIWDITTGKWMAKLVSFNDGAWAVVDPEGRYDAANGNASGLHWVVNTEPIDLVQLKERYYEPGLLAKILGFNKEPLRPVQTFTSVALFPEIRIQPPSDKADALISLKNRGGGIGKVRVLVNGKEIAADARGPKTDPAAQSLELPIEIPESLLIPGEENTLQVLAWNGEGYLSSRGEPVRFRAPPATKVEPPTLYAIVAGVSKYANPAMNLTYSGKDAADIAQALNISAKRLFGAEKVNISLLTDYSDPSHSDSQKTGFKSLPLTRENLENAFRLARKAKAGDILVIYLAGHGVMSSGDGSDYYYLTSEARTTDLSDPAIRKQSGVSSAELTEWIKQIPALKQVMVLDTCAAGGAVTKLVEQRSLSSDQVRSLERLKDRTGFHILMGAAADKQSLEATQYGQGLLTWAILQGMKGAALRDDQFVDVQKLFQHAADEVPRLARSVGGIQKPLIASPRGTSFDIGQLTAADKPLIPLATVKPMILKVSINSAVPPKKDDIKLSSFINAALREQSANPRGSGIVYVDAEELPGAYILSGDYRKQGDNVTIEVYVTSGETQKGNFTTSGKVSDLATLAKDIVKRAGDLVQE